MRRKPTWRRGAPSLLLAALLSTSAAGQGDAPCALPSPLTLQAALDCVVGTHPAVAAARLEVQRAEVDLLKARALRRPDLGFGLETGVVPEARGDVLSSADESDDLDGLGPFYRLRLDAVVPIHTFGKIESTRSAAERGVEARRQGSEATVAELALETVRAFWGLYSAVEALELADDLTSGWEELLTEVEKAVEDPDSEVDHTDLLEVKSREYQIILAAEEARRNRTIARTGLSLLLGQKLDEELELEPPDDPVLDDPTAVEDDVVALALRSNPRVRQLRSGLGALEAQLALAEAFRWPDLFVAGSVRYARADNRTDQTNPFVKDDFNFRTVSAFIGLRWNLNFHNHGLEIEQKRAQRDETAYKLEVAEQRLRLETVRSLAEAAEQRALLTTAERSRVAARSWVRLSGDNWELGLGSPNRLIDAYEAFYRLGGAVIEKTADFHVSLAGLAVASGDIGRYLEWTRDGEIAIP